MNFDAPSILAVLDRCCDTFIFPMLDNGYVYLAATRLSLYRSVTDWAMVIEVFGFSPRAGLPDTHIHTFASTLHDRDSPEKYASRKAYEDYLSNNPHNDSRFVFPISEGPWQDAMDSELVATDAKGIALRGEPLALPSYDEYEKHGIELEQPSRIQVYELCRLLADIARTKVLATAQEQRISVLPDMKQILQLEEWHHPNIVEDDRPSSSETFRQLAQVLETGDLKLYHPSKQPNTHWRNWPDGGTL
ncbi:MAG: hypothetical protein DMG35_04235 [Acidobacteria bacterium]|nr:MAG: hypothetical protein DMG35_04235 [Acidobacteriota bacterium]